MCVAYKAYLVSVVLTQHVGAMLTAKVLSVWGQQNFGPSGIFYHSKTGINQKSGLGSL